MSSWTSCRVWTLHGWTEMSGRYKRVALVGSEELDLQNHSMSDDISLVELSNLGTPTLLNARKEQVKTVIFVKWSTMRVRQASNAVVFGSETAEALFRLPVISQMLSEVSSNLASLTCLYRSI